MAFDSPAATKSSAGLSGLRGRLIAGLVNRILPPMGVGRLLLVLPSGETIERNGSQPGPDATITIQRWRGLWRMLRDGEHGFIDGYLDGDWLTPDLVKLLEFFMHNEAAIAKSAESSWLTFIRNRLQHRLRENTKRGSRRNIAAHYDLGNQFYQLWLDRSMNYSSAIYKDGDTLESAQAAKIERITELLGLAGDENILEIGCGWGAVAERVLQEPATQYVGLTLSSEQLAYAKGRLAEKGARADFRLQDYRGVAGTFDRIASIEMFEAVGERYWPVYFDRIRALLAEGGAAVLQIITIDEKRFETYRKTPDFIQRYIFPGGVLPTATIIEREIRRAGLRLVHCEAFGQSYALTLREWRHRFLRSWPKIEALGFDQHFRRMWEYYLAYCEVGFRFGSIDVKLFQLAR